MNVARLTAIAAACFALSSPAYADDASSISTKIAAAAKAINSFVIVMQFNGTTGVGGTITVVRPMAFKSEMNMGRMTMETYFVGNTVYINSPAVGWQKTTVDLQHRPQQALDIANMMKQAHSTALADRQENGVTVGVIKIDTPTPATATPMIQQAASNLVCTYDKKSYLMRTCTNGMMTMKYTKYNDPANVVVLPDEAKNAVPLVITTPAAAAMPAATGTPGTMSPVPVPVGSAMPASPAPTDSPSPSAAPGASPTATPML